MMGSNLMEEIDCGSFFDQIDDLIEFPADNCTDFHGIWSNSDPIFSANNTNNNSSHISPEIAVPYEDIVQLEWISNFVEDSFSGGGMMIGKEHTPVEPHNQFQTSSPVSVLESSSSSSSSETSSSEGKNMPLSPTHRGPQRARTKRPRPATFNPRLPIQLISPTSSVSSESKNFALSHNPIKKIPTPSDLEHKSSDPEHKKKKIKKIKFSLPSAPVEMNRNPPSQTLRKCMHCEITKTPQWRAGPMGPKTLCNACGVRHKSGRLFPEYRPAASPTFVPSLHSNSHKKVIEMRTKVCDESSIYGTEATIQTERAVSSE